MSRFESIQDVWDYLDAIPKFQTSGSAAANFSLENMISICRELGNPQEQFKSIHVAGTNGKGTTCYILEKVYSDAGYRTGLFTSPHLLRYNERVRVGQQEIPDTDILRFFRFAEQQLEQISLSYFEISTALAFWYFADQQVELAVIETGLGGRLDSTNIITPEISVITSVGLDHQNILGDTIGEIAREKAGIIKEGKPVVIGDLSAEAEAAVRYRVQSTGSILYRAGELQPEWDKGTLRLKGELKEIPTVLIEPVNKWNFAIAWQVVRVLNDALPVSESSLVGSFETFEGAPARFEKLHPGHAWYFSGSHNPQALAASIEAIEMLGEIGDSVLVFSAMKDKLQPEFLDRFSSFREVYFVEQEGDRAAKRTDIPDELQVQLMDENNFETILNELQSELVIFAGSFYFYPIIKRWIKNLNS